MADRYTEAFDSVMAAYRLPKTTDAEKEGRRRAIADSTVTATEVPLATAKASADVARLLLSVAEHGNINALSDCSLAVECARTAVRGALMNVAINLPGIKNPDRADAFARQSEELKRQSEELYKKGTAILLDRQAT